MMTGFGTLTAKDVDGNLTQVNGLYAAFSFDEGENWPAEYRRIISDNSKTVEIAPWQHLANLSMTTSQTGGYMSATQTPDGMIYLTDGKIVFSFNLAWIME